MRRYPRKWIAVLDGEVSLTANSLDVLVRKAERARLPRGEFLIEYMDPNPQVRIL